MCEEEYRLTRRRPQKGTAQTTSWKLRCMDDDETANNATRNDVVVTDVILALILKITAIKIFEKPLTNSPMRSNEAETEDKLSFIVWNHWDCDLSQ